MRALMLKQKEVLNTIPAFDEHILFSLERRYFEFLDMKRLELCYNSSADNFDLLTDLRMIRMKEISHEGDPDMGIHLMQFQNVLAALHGNSHGGEPSHNMVSMIHSRHNSTALYYGLAKRKDHASDVGTGELFKLLGRSIHGNFLGASFDEMSAGAIENGVCNPLNSYDYITAFPGIPSTRDRHGPYVQGIDRFIEAMRGEEYAVLCIAEPIKLAPLDGMIGNLFSISSQVHSQVKATVQRMKGSSDTVNVGMFGMMGTMESQTQSESTTEGSSEADTIAGPAAAAGAAVTAAGMVGGAIAGAKLGGIIGSVIPGAGTMVGVGIGAAAGGLAGPLISYFGKLPLASTTSKMNSFTRSLANTAGSSMGGGAFGGYARSWNRSTSVSQEVLNKTAEHCEKLCDTYVSRLQKGKNLGMWNVGVYLLTKDKYTQLRGQGLLRACLAGDETFWEPIRALPLQDDAAGAYLVNFNNPRYNLLQYGSERREIETAVSWGARLAEAAKRVADGSLEKLVGLFYNKDDATSTAVLEQIRRSPGSYTPEALEKAWEEVGKCQIGHPLGPAMAGVSTPMNTEELSIIMNIPRREVQGITIREAAEFGINYTPRLDARHVEIGKFIHKRRVVSDLPFTLPLPLFQKHAFVCGVTGSGKTNTCFSLLTKIDLPFMVIEPAKGEYRRLLKDFRDIQIYTLGDETISPFRLNPFEFNYSANTRDGRLMFHIDTVKTAFNAAFPMYGPMAYILEDAIVAIYRDKGWDLAVSENSYLKRMAGSERDARFHDYLPTLRELYNKVERIVSQKRYAPEQRMNIEAALKSRLSSLITGSKGLMLDCKRSIPMAELLSGRIVLELKHMGDDDEKCFLMGLLLGQMYAYRESEKQSGSDLRHIVLVEEAHRLLRKVPDFVSPEIGNSRGKAVETFCNVVSEIRDYGEGIIIVDQIPGKLAVDAVKNTSVKIVHRTLASDDRELLSGTMGLTPAQSNELPLLGVGRAVVHSEGADKPFLVRIDKSKEQDGSPVSDARVREVMEPMNQKRPWLFRRYPGFEKAPEIPELFRVMDMQRFHKDIYSLVIAAAAFMVSQGDLPTGFRKRANRQIADLVHCDEKREADCYIVWYVNLFFEALVESFPVSVDHAIAGQQAFIDVWFSSGPARQQAMALREALSATLRSRDPLHYLTQCLFFDDGSSRRNDGALRGIAKELAAGGVHGDDNALTALVTRFCERFLAGSTPDVAMAREIALLAAPGFIPA